MTVDSERDSEFTAQGEPWGARLYLALAIVLLVSGAIQGYGMSTWPMADDEVLSLVQLGYFYVEPADFPFPADLLDKLPKAVPVWHAVQRRALELLPHTPGGFRLPSVCCGVLTAAVLFLFAARSRGLWFGAALAILISGSQLFLQVAQVNRFYSLPMLLVVLTFAAMWWPRGGISIALLTAGLAVLAVLSHNVTVAVFGLAFVAACFAWPIGRAPRRVVLRSGAAFLATGLVYGLYLLPLVRGWSTTGNPTPVLVSFAAYAGVPTLALGLLGTWVCLGRWKREETTLWCALMFAGSLCVFYLSTFSWNPRYFVFFLPGLWIVAAEGVHQIAERLHYGMVAAAWYGAVVLILSPAVLSHFLDGSRHDYRQAGAVLATQASANAPILSDDAETLTYYLPAELRPTLSARTKARQFPASEFFLVVRANVWAPLPSIPQRRMELLAEIFKRRYDAFSHVVRVYRVGPVEGR